MRGVQGIVDLRTECARNAGGGGACGRRQTLWVAMPPRSWCGGEGFWPRGVRLLVSAIVTFLSLPAAGATVQDAQALFNAGKYAECIAMAAEGMQADSREETWWHVKICAEMETGKYAEALATLSEGLERFRTSVRLRVRGQDVARFNGLGERASEMLEEIDYLVRRQQWRYTSPEDRVALGQYFLLRGADPRQVLEIFYDPLVKATPASAEAALATGELALGKRDFALATEAFEKAASLSPGDPAPLCGIARACMESDAERAGKALTKALELNPSHIDSLLAGADNRIDAENYAGAKEFLARALAVNPKEPRACAYQAVIAHVEGDRKGEAAWRTTALSAWAKNPAVDHLIGRKLSQKYRFAEGAACQRRALGMDAGFLPARLDLAQDILRLGDDPLGWRLVDEVHKADAYNVVAYNLATLRDVMAKFATLRGEGIVLRLDAREAGLYGQDALALLARAKEKLCAKYEVAFDGPVVVEIFPERKDFAIRTFGLPGGAGFLGVCFGQVVTALSPAAQRERPTCWRAVLWHELCHSVTLKKSRNTMPRWLSEGISVYEEHLADPAWGRAMDADTRRMIAEGALVPVSGLSGAFLNPPTPAHLQFAYHESALVVEYLVRTYGDKCLVAILSDLSAGTPIAAALERHAAPLAKLDEAFAAFAAERAAAFAPGANWEEPSLPVVASDEAVADWNKAHPDNIPGLKLAARRLIAAKRWDDAKAVLLRLRDLHPEDAESDSVYRMLAAVSRELGEKDAERAALAQIVARDGDAQDALARAMELAAEAKDWQAVLGGAERMLGVNPLVPLPYRMRARAAEELGDLASAIPAYRALLVLDPVDPADTNFRLARALFTQGELAAARRHVLDSLEAAPRFRPAHALLLEIVERAAASGTAGDAPAKEEKP